MKKTLMVLMMLIFTASIFAGEEKKELTVYVYDSMEWIKEKMIPAFEKENKITVKLVKFTDAGNIVSRLKLEAKNPKADIAIGLTQALTIAAKKDNLLKKYTPINAKNIADKKNVFDADFYSTPYDYGSLAFVYNPEKISIIPKSFEDMTKLNKQIIISDPRISSTGQDFLLWTIAVYKDNWKDYWKRLKPAILAITPGWSEAFAKFEAGEAPIMLSYATDGAYSFQYYKSVKYKAFIPAEGGYSQTEGVSIVRGTKNEELAKKFVEFMLTDEFQNEVPLNQWMFPVKKITMPDAFQYAVTAEKTVSLTNKEIGDNMKNWIKEWEKIMQ